LVPNDYVWKNKLLSRTVFSFNKVTGQWFVALESVLFYSDITTSVHDVNQQSVAVYPNPSEDFITIRTKLDQAGILQIFDLQGRSIMQKQIYNGESVNLSHLSSGLYVYRVYFKGILQSGKLVKK
jgi:hypothetical protein